MPDLGAAAAVWEKLGFAVTPVSHHEVGGKPAGTSNRCVMLEQGYLEILAPTLDTPNAQRVRERMKRFVGVHLACFGTPAAAAERERLAAQGFDPEPVIHLQRKVENGHAGFKVVYVPPGKMPEGRVQYCEHLTPQQVWREGFVNPFRLRAVYVVADEPEEVAARWGRFGGLLPRPEDGFVRLDTARGQVRIGKRSSIERALGQCPPAPALAGYALSCADPDGFVSQCSSQGLKVKNRTVTLPAQLGGAWLIE